jgi:hypothetical protein
MHPEDSLPSAVTAEPGGHPGPWPELLRLTPGVPFAGVRGYLDVQAWEAMALGWLDGR